MSTTSRKIHSNKRKRKCRLVRGQSQHSAVQQRSRGRPDAILKEDLSKIGVSDLPGELRNLIYFYALSSTTGKAVRLNDNLPQGSQVALSLLLSCKVISREAASILYGEIGFRIDMSWFARSKRSNETPDRNDVLGLRAWNRLGILGPQRIGSIRALTLAYRGVGRRVLGTGPLSEKASIVLQLRLLPREPRFTLVPLPDLSREKVEVLQHALQSLLPWFVDMFSIRGLKAFSRRDLYAIIDKFRWKSQNAILVEGRQIREMS